MADERKLSSVTGDYDARVVHFNPEASRKPLNRGELFHVISRLLTLTAKQNLALAGLTRGDSALFSKLMTEALTEHDDICAMLEGLVTDPDATTNG